MKRTLLIALMLTAYSYTAVSGGLIPGEYYCINPSNGANGYEVWVGYFSNGIMGLGVGQEVVSVSKDCKVINLDGFEDKTMNSKCSPTRDKMEVSLTEGRHDREVTTMLSWQQNGDKIIATETQVLGKETKKAYNDLGIDSNDVVTRLICKR